MREDRPSSHGRARPLAAMLLAAAAVLWASGTQAESAPDDHFDCAQLAREEEPESAAGWFERSLWASHCYVFQASAVRIGSDGVRTLALSHDIREGIELEVARFLDGPAVVFERQGRIGRLSWSAPGHSVPASPEGISRHLEGLYRLQLSGEERIASRRAVRLDIEPLDNLRYGHRLWLDADTALPLKQVLLDEQGRVVETFQITELRQPELHEGVVGLDPGRRPPDDPWRPGWLPKGFVPQPVETSSGRHRGVSHRVYGDGLSTLSLFVEPVGERDLLMPGMHRLGVSHAAVRHRELGGQARQVVVMGELPPRVLMRVAEAVEWSGDEAAGTTPAASSDVMPGSADEP